MTSKSVLTHAIDHDPATQQIRLSRLLDHHYLCESLTVNEVRTLLEYLTYLEFDKGKILSEIGSVGDALYFVVQGQIALAFVEQDQENEIAYAGSGEMLGEMSFFDKLPRSVRLVVKEPSTQVLKLSRTMYKRLKSEHPFIAINIVEHAIVSLDRLFRAVSTNYSHFSHYLYRTGK
ncbi:MAG: cyclic nucleotide-binding domain-containing protein [Ferrovum sp.]|nr:cyclic nucleotide-binding domain-containing protein [Ferrovum sp.]NDU87828.1 cyclic nucleotide-binding domain-containing protein [Ferrovum sp.]